MAELLEVVSVAVACLWLIPAAVQGQFSDCPMLLECELGNTTVPVRTGLLVEALSFATGDTSLNVRLVRYNIVCLAQGSVRDRYRSLSLIASYAPAGGMETTVQLHLQCIAGAWSVVNLGSSMAAVSNAFTGTLDTVLLTNCFLCITPSLEPKVTADEHCLGQSS